MPLWRRDDVAVAQRQCLCGTEALSLWYGSIVPVGQSHRLNGTERQDIMWLWQRRTMQNGMKQVHLGRFGLILGHNRSQRLWGVSGTPLGLPTVNKIREILVFLLCSWGEVVCWQGG